MSGLSVPCSSDGGHAGGAIYCSSKFTNFCIYLHFIRGNKQNPTLHWSLKGSINIVDATIDSSKPFML